MKYLKIILLIAAFLVININSIYSQATTRIDTIENTNRTIGYLTASSYLPFAFGLGISANAEFPVYYTRGFSINFKAGYGIAGFGDYDGGGSGFTFGTASSVFIFGKKVTKFELNAGLGVVSGLSPGRANFNGLIPSFGLGIRMYYHKKIIRLGIGFPELMHFSLGIYF